MEISIPVIRICEVLADNGFESYLVGGAIRDFLMGRKPHDFDIATNAHPEQVLPLFDKVIPTGIKHGTVTVMLDDIGYEITTYRGDQFSYHNLDK